MSDANSQTQTTVQIQMMGIDDIAAIFHLGEQLFVSDLYPSLYRLWDQWEVTGAFNSDPDLCFVATVEDKFAGFILGTLVEKHHNTYSYIRWLGVSPDFHRLGIAGKLLDRLIERTIAQGADTVLMDTDPANEAAIRFFSKQGFRNPREHVYLTLDLASHNYYGKLLEYERDRAEQLTQILRHRYQ